jgi:hypothetical protein
MEEKTLKERLLHIFIISIFCSLYFLVATISMINSVAFFDLSHSGLMSWSLAIGFEIGAAASLAAIIILDKTNKTMVWGLFLLLTSFQMMANSFHAFINLEDYMGWIELFGLEEEEPIVQKRILSIVSGAVLPLVALGFIKSLVDYVRPPKDVADEEVDNLPVTDEGPYTFETDKEVDELENMLVVDEGLLTEDLYSRDAIIAPTPVVIGKVRVAPEIVNTNHAVVDDVEQPIITEHITSVGDPEIIPTADVLIPNKDAKPPLVARSYVRTNTPYKP